VRRSAPVLRVARFFFFCANTGSGDDLAQAGRPVPAHPGGGVLDRADTLRGVGRGSHGPNAAHGRTGSPIPRNRSPDPSLDLDGDHRSDRYRHRQPVLPAHRPSGACQRVTLPTGFGWLLAGKVVAALGMFTHAAIHDFVYGRRTRRIHAEMAQAGPERRRDLEAAYARARRGAAATGRGNLLLAIIVLAFAAGLGVRT